MFAVVKHSFVMFAYSFFFYCRTARMLCFAVKKHCTNGFGECIVYMCVWAKCRSVTTACIQLSELHIGIYDRLCCSSSLNEFTFGAIVREREEERDRERKRERRLCEWKVERTFSWVCHVHLFRFCCSSTACMRVFVMYICEYVCVAVCVAVCVIVYLVSTIYSSWSRPNAHMQKW